MDLLLWSDGVAKVVLVSRRVSGLFKLSRLVAALCGVIAILICGSGRTAIGQTAYFSGAQTTVGSGFTEPQGVAVDKSGNVYVADAQNFAIYEMVAVNGILPASPTIRVLAKNVGNPEGVAVDSNGNVYFTNLDVYSNFGNNWVNEIVAVNGVIPDSPTIRQLGSGLFYPGGVAVDGSGNVYVADTDHHVVKEMLAVNGSVPPSPTILTFSTPNSQPKSVAVDSSGNLYVFDGATIFGATDNGEVIEIEAVNGTIPASPTTRVLGTGFCGGWGVAVDSSGNVYATGCSTFVTEFLAVNGVIPTSPTIENRGSNLSGPWGIAVDGSGNIYVGEEVSSTIPEIYPWSSDFGPVNIGTASNQVKSMPFTFTTAGALGSTAVLTQGATGLDFTDAGTGTCAAKTEYAAGQICTVNVSFTPEFAGPRYGAVELNDTNGNVMATVYLQGTGVGPQLTYSGGTQTTLSSSFDFASGVAVDGSGNAYIIDKINNLGNVQEVMAVNGKIPANPTINTLVGGLDCPSGPALDATGDVYFVDGCYHTVNEIQAVNGSIPPSPTVRTLTSRFVLPAGVAVDSSGNVYVLDASNNTVNEIYAVNGSIPASPTIAMLASGFKEVDSIAVDDNGNLYVSDDKSREVFEIHAVNGSIPASPLVTSLGSGWVIPRGIAVDALGNVYVAEYFYDTVYKLLAVNGSIPASPVIQTLGSGLVYANGVALDGKRNVFVADYGDARLVTLDYADAPSLTFASTPVGSTSTDSPQTVTLENVGNADLTLPIPASGNNPSVSANFTLDDNAPSACPVTGSGSSTAGTLAAGGSCALTIGFSPTTAGSLSGSLVLTDNNLNAPGPGYASQSITLSGTATPAAPTITWAAPAPINYGTALSGVQLNATASVPGTFNYSPMVGAVLSAGTQTLTVTFTPTDTTDYTTANATEQLTVNKATSVITWPTPAPITYGTALSGAQLDATASVPGTFSYSPVVGTVLGAGTQTLSVTFTPTDTTDYTTANASVQLTVNKAAPVFTWPTPAPITYGTALGGMQLDATAASVPGTFSYSPAAGTVLSAGTQTLSVTFTPTDMTDYMTASTTAQLTVNKATPVITWPTPAPINYGTALSGAQLNATVSVPGTFSYSPAAGTVLSAGTQTLTATFTPTDATDYTKANASVQLTVNKATPVITWLTPAPIYYGTALSSTQLNATANVPGSFVYNPSAGTVLAAGTDTLKTTFTPTDGADYTTASASVTLTVINPSFALSASPASLSLKQGSNATSTISITALGRFSGKVKLASSGLPKGVTATFSPNPATTTSTLKFTVSSGATPGASSVKISGTSGSLVETTTIALTVVLK